MMMMLMMMMMMMMMYWFNVQFYYRNRNKEGLFINKGQVWQCTSIDSRMARQKAVNIWNP